jgi:hypothetical protein
MFADQAGQGGFSGPAVSDNRCFHGASFTAALFFSRTSAEAFSSGTEGSPYENSCRIRQLLSKIHNRPGAAAFFPGSGGRRFRNPFRLF